jgi:hypothetical protein
MKHPMITKLFFSVSLCVLLAACGGGGNGSSSSDITDPLKKSASQMIFEESALSVNGGQYSLNFGSRGNINSLPSLTSANYNGFSLPSSPLGNITGITATNIATATIANSISAGLLADSFFVEAGTIETVPNDAKTRYRYDGNDIIVETFSTSGVLVSSIKITEMTKVPLTGTFANTPTELRDILAPAENLLPATATYAVGSAYYKRIASTIGDRLNLLDADNSQTTNPGSVTPLAQDNLSSYLASNIVNSSTTGQTRTIKGLSCWIKNTPNQDLNNSIFTPGLSPTFRGVCQQGTNIYLVNYVPSGTESGFPYLNRNSQVQRVNFTIRYNKAAIDSLLAAVTAASSSGSSGASANP